MGPVGIPTIVAHSIQIGSIQTGLIQGRQNPRPIPSKGYHQRDTIEGRCDLMSFEHLRFGYSTSLRCRRPARPILPTGTSPVGTCLVDNP